MAIKSFTEYTYEHNTGDVFPLPFNPESDPEHVYISPDGLKAVLAFLVRDEDAADPASYADSSIEQYSQWCEGDVYGVCVWTYQRDSIEDGWPEDPERDECWGYYGSEGYTAEELQDRFNAAVNSH